MFERRPLPGLPGGTTTTEKPHITFPFITSHPPAHCNVSQTIERGAGLEIVRLEDLRVETAAVAQ